MKKKYEKPYIVVESFQLNAAIASACSKEHKLALNYNMDTCKITNIPGFTYFGKACVHSVHVDGDGYDEICYHGPKASATDVALKS